MTKMQASILFETNSKGVKHNYDVIVWGIDCIANDIESTFTDCACTQNGRAMRINVIMHRFMEVNSQTVMIIWIVLLYLTFFRT